MSHEHVHWRVVYQGQGAELPVMTQVMASHGVRVAARPVGSGRRGANVPGQVRVDLKADGAAAEIRSAADEFLRQAPGCQLEILEHAAD